MGCAKGGSVTSTTTAPPALAAELLNVSVDSIKVARKVVEGDNPALIAAVERGQMAVSRAAATPGRLPEFRPSRRRFR